jgi:hypothetical protein
MKISETKLRKVVRRQLQIKKLDKLSKRLTENQTGQEGQNDALGGASKDYKPKHGDKMPTSKSEAGSYMLNAVRSAGGVTSQEIPALIQFFDDLLDQFINQNMTASKAKKVGAGIEIGKSRAGIRGE